MPLVQLTPYQCYLRHCERWKNGCGAGICSRAQHVVLARGGVPCDILFIGEGPGESEDSLGYPFAGPAGHLLNEIILQGVPHQVEIGEDGSTEHFVPDITYALTNLVGCMPTDEDGMKSGEPEDEDVKKCTPRLQEFVTIADPRLVVCVGALARSWLDPMYKHSIRLHREIPKVALTHPAAILRYNIAHRGLAVQRAIVTLSEAIEEHLA